MLRRIITLLLLLPLISFAEDFVQGKDYELINTNSSQEKSLKPTVTEFFSYGCPWCYRIENSLSTWVTQKGDAIQFSRIPVIFNKDWTYYAKAYYTANLLGREKELNPALFKAIQIDKKSLNSNEAMINFFIANGIDNAIATSAFENSTTLDLKISQDAQLMSEFQVKGIPAIVINNQYKIDLQMAQNEERLYKILDFLISKSTKETKKS